jgi:hypothetical protein
MIYTLLVFVNDIVIRVHLHSPSLYKIRKETGPTSQRRQKQKRATTA